VQNLCLCSVHLCRDVPQVEKLCGIDACRRHACRTPRRAWARPCAIACTGHNALSWQVAGCLGSHPYARTLGRADIRSRARWWSWRRNAGADVAAPCCARGRWCCPVASAWTTACACGARATPRGPWCRHARPCRPSRNAISSERDWFSLCAHVKQARRARMSGVLGCGALCVPVRSGTGSAEALKAEGREPPLDMGVRAEWQSCGTT
jgi:hypothetical protein